MRRIAVAGLMVAGSLAGLTAHADESNGCSVVATNANAVTCSYTATGDGHVAAQGDWEISVYDGNVLVDNFTDEETALSRDEGINAPFLSTEFDIRPGDQVFLIARGAGSFVRVGEPASSILPSV